MVVVLFVNVYFNLVYYPALIKYQSDSEAAFYVNAHNPSHFPLVKMVNGSFYAMDFYARQRVYDYHTGEEHLLPPKPYLFFAETAVIDEMKRNGIKVQAVKTFESFHVTRVNGKFLNHRTRSQVLETSQLVLIK